MYTKLKNKAVGFVVPHFFDEYLLIALSKNWIQACNGLPKFQILIDDEGRLCLVGPKAHSVCMSLSVCVSLSACFSFSVWMSVSLCMS